MRSSATACSARSWPTCSSDGRTRLMVVAANALISVTPGLMIWTIVCFLIALFVLKRYAFGPIQRMIDERREQIRRSLDEADNARDEARRLLEEHRALMREARGEAEQILAAARRTRASRSRSSGMAVAHRIYADALFEAAKAGGRLMQVHEALSDFAAAVEQTPELRAVLRNPQLESSAKGRILADLAGEEEPLFTNFLLLTAEKGRAGELEEIAREFERLMAREERRLTVELTTARELTDEEAQAIVAQIEQASGRTVEATRSVDPAILGGIVLQAGSYLADASVRGRLERLRQTLVRS